MEFWVNDKGRIRLFTVVEADKKKAQQICTVGFPASSLRRGSRRATHNQWSA
jgi:hypothetical protein